MKFLRHTAAKTELPEPTQHTHHHHAPNYLPSMLWGLVCLLGLGWLLYRWILSLLASLGASNPQATFAMIFLAFLVGLPLGWLVNGALHGWAEARHRRRLEIERLRIERLEIEHRLQTSTIADSRATDPNEKRRNALITAIMVDAYHHGEYSAREKRPWARRNAGQYILTGESEPVGENSTVVSEAVDWLRDNDILTGRKGREQINTSQYPNLAAVQRRLHKPILA